MKKFFSQKGFTLLETFVAVAILVMVVSGPVSLAITSMGLASVSQNQLVASYLGQEGVEIIRNIRDGNFINNRSWLSGLGPCSNINNGCYIDVNSLNFNAISCGVKCPVLKYDSNLNVPYNYSSGQDTIFTRIITVDPVPGKTDEAEIKVTVSWSEKYQDTKSFVIQENIFDWKP